MPKIKPGKHNIKEKLKKGSLCTFNIDDKTGDIEFEPRGVLKKKEARVVCLDEINLGDEIEYMILLRKK